MKRTLLLTIAAASATFAAENVLTFDPPQTQIHWTLDSALHTVHGSFHLKGGTIRFDPESGKAAGQLIVSAMSGESGNDSRDKRMHQSILESNKFTDIVFTPDKVNGQVAAQGQSQIQVHGTFRLHGTDHEFTMPVEVEMKDGQAIASSHFAIPYIKWGLKNPSVFMLKVNDTVQIGIEAKARVGSAN
jgi:polyisoprenoid-binding protein YceI